MDDGFRLNERLTELELQVRQLRKACLIFAACAGLLAVCYLVPSIGTMVGMLIGLPLAIALVLACLYGVWWFLEYSVPPETPPVTPNHSSDPTRSA